MSHIKVNTETLNDIMKELSKLIAIVNDAERSIESSYRRAGSSWNDSKYVELGDLVQQTTSTLKKSSSTLSQIVTNVKKLQAKVEVYLS